MRIAVHIHYYLFQKIRIVIFCIHIQRLTKKGNISRNTRTVIPRFLLVQMRSNLHLAATCQTIIILRQYMIRTISLAGRQTEMQIFIRIIFDVGTRRHKEAVLTTVISPNTSHQHQLIVQIECILDISSRNRLLHKFLRQPFFCLIRQPIVLIVTIIVKT